MMTERVGMLGIISIKEVIAGIFIKGCQIKGYGRAIILIMEQGIKDYMIIGGKYFRVVT